MRRSPVAAAIMAVGLLLAMAGITPTAWAQATAASPTLSKFTEQLVVPAKIDARSGTPVALTEMAAKHKFHAKLPAPASTWGYVPTGQAPSDVYLGPTIEARRGQPVNVTVTNALKGHPLAAAIDTSIAGVTATDATYPRTATHLHGGHVQAAFDGGPTEWYRVGAAKDRTDYAGGTGRFTYQYANDQQAATLWYHDHALGITRLNVQAGLAGFYLLRDQYDTGDVSNQLGLPSGYGTYEIPLVFQDRAFNPDGSLAYPAGGWAPEFFGDVATVNGKAWPNLNVKRGLYRFRLLNGSNSRFYNLTLGAPMYQIGTDGGLLNAPVLLNSLVLAPGERADVLIDFSTTAAGTKLVLGNAPLPDQVVSPADVELPQLMQFTVGADQGFTGAVPATLRGGPNQPPTIGTLPTGSTTRTVMLNEIIDPATDMPTMSLLNNLSFHGSGGGARTDSIETPAKNTVEQWRIVNTTADTHPIHLHLVQFKVVQRQQFDVDGYLEAVNAKLTADNPGSTFDLPEDPSAAGKGPWPAVDVTPYLTEGTVTGPDAGEGGWKDTVQAHPGQVLTIQAPFGGTTGGLTAAPYTGSFTGNYVWHCHILEHEDNEMMLPYRVTN